MASSLARSTSVVGAMTFCSRILGFVRDVVLAVMFGAGPAMDAFLVAFKIPNFLRRLFAEGAFAQSFVPVLSATRDQESGDEVKELVSVVAGTLGVILIGLTIIGVIAAPLLIYAFAPGFAESPGQFSLAVDMLRITFPYLLFISLTALAGGILNTYGQFAVPAVTPVLLNFCMIGAALGLSPFFAQPQIALAIGVFIAGVVQLAFQVPFLLRIDRLPRPRWGWSNAKVRRILRLMLPIMFGSSVAQITLLLDTIVASFLAAGSVSWLYYADRLMEFPLGIFSVAIATVILPTLSARHASASKDEFSATLDWALRLLALLGLPAMVGLFVLSGPLVSTLFNYRSFGAHDALMSQYALMAYSLGFMGFSLVKVLVTGFYSREDSRTPVRCGVISMISAMAMNLIFVGIFLFMHWPAPHAGLALAGSLGAFVNAGLLFRNLRASGAYAPGAGWAGLLWRVALACIVMAAVLHFGAATNAVWVSRTALMRVAWLSIWIGAGIAIYFIVLGLFGIRPHQFRLGHGSTK
ncbi:murein biosynthesis integral membrane protein MurJ [Salinisphaera hydrothermalis]|uniref:Probable lipid II flippase MurJ n=1 Tax=Salinisphaera hydrothermalis (strain C41B8) TaxID=1304275 RepID=A0A084IJL0_SALHC|nr:murein biosynthesis integral membrane protein MurJ [Salinisphaera hydrothermalis]KEZ76894.1 peptidoglycan lipid II flippase MurJ [Salinisphaera hydrothermalis C41B8]